MNSFTQHLIISLLILLAACSGNKSKIAIEDTDTSASAEAGSELELPMPEFPAGMTNPQQRAQFYIDHFWDKMDFKDTTRTHSTEFMEQNFANYFAVFPAVDRQILTKSISNLLSRAKVDTAAFNQVTRIAYKYLYDPNSPMLNEDLYALFLPLLINDDSLDEADRERWKYQLQSINKNRPGTMAADFSYSDRQTKKHTLRNTPSADMLLLLFFDPECDHCQATIDEMKKSERINQLISQGKMTILAVCAEGDKETWKKSNKIPTNWLEGYDESRVEDNDIFVIRAMPTIYLLDSQKRILLKDVLLNQLLSYLDTPR